MITLTVAEPIFSKKAHGAHTYQFIPLLYLNIKSFFIQRLCTNGLNIAGQSGTRCTSLVVLRTSYQYKYYTSECAVPP